MRTMRTQPCIYETVQTRKRASTVFSQAMGPSWDTMIAVQLELSKVCDDDTVSNVVKRCGKTCKRVNLNAAGSGDIGAVRQFVI